MRTSPVRTSAAEFERRRAMSALGASVAALATPAGCATSTFPALARLPHCDGLSDIRQELGRTQVYEILGRHGDGRGWGPLCLGPVAARGTATLSGSLARRCLASAAVVTVATTGAIALALSTGMSTSLFALLQALGSVEAVDVVLSSTRSVAADTFAGSGLRCDRACDGAWSPTSGRPMETGGRCHRLLGRGNLIGHVVQTCELKVKALWLAVSGTVALGHAAFHLDDHSGIRRWGRRFSCPRGDLFVLVTHHHRACCGSPLQRQTGSEILLLGRRHAQLHGTSRFLNVNLKLFARQVSWNLADGREALATEGRGSGSRRVRGVELAAVWWANEGSGDIVSAGGDCRIGDGCWAGSDRSLSAVSLRKEL